MRHALQHRHSAKPMTSAIKFLYFQGRYWLSAPGLLLVWQPGADTDRIHPQFHLQFRERRDVQNWMRIAERKRKAAAQ